MSDNLKRTRYWVAHLDDERSQREHAFWYRFASNPGLVYFTFKRAEDIPETCHCGNKFYLVATPDDP